MAQDISDHPIAHTADPVNQGLDEADALGPEYRQRITPIGQPFLSPKRLEPIVHRSMAVLDLTPTAQPLNILQFWPEETFGTFDGAIASASPNLLTIDNASIQPHPSSLNLSQIPSTPYHQNVSKFTPQASIARSPTNSQVKRQEEPGKPGGRGGKTQATPHSDAPNPALQKAPSPPVQISKGFRLLTPAQRSPQLQRQLKHVKAKTLRSLQSLSLQQTSQVHINSQPAPVRSGEQPTTQRPPQPSLAIQTVQTQNLASPPPPAAPAAPAAIDHATTSAPAAPDVQPQNLASPTPSAPSASPAASADIQRQNPASPSSPAASPSSPAPLASAPTVQPENLASSQHPLEKVTRLLQRSETVKQQIQNTKSHIVDSIQKSDIAPLLNWEQSESPAQDPSVQASFSETFGPELPIGAEVPEPRTISSMSTPSETIQQHPQQEIASNSPTVNRQQNASLENSTPQTSVDPTDVDPTDRTIAPLNNPARSEPSTPLSQETGRPRKPASPLPLQPKMEVIADAPPLQPKTAQSQAEYRQSRQINAEVTSPVESESQSLAAISVTQPVTETVKNASVLRSHVEPINVQNSIDQHTNREITFSESLSVADSVQRSPEPVQSSQELDPVSELTLRSQASSEDPMQRNTQQPISESWVGNRSATEAELPVTSKVQQLSETPVESCPEPQASSEAMVISALHIQKAWTNSVNRQPSESITAGDAEVSSLHVVSSDSQAQSESEPPDSPQLPDGNRSTVEGQLQRDALTHGVTSLPQSTKASDIIKDSKFVDAIAQIQSETSPQAPPSVPQSEFAQQKLRLPKSDSFVTADDASSPTSISIQRKSESKQSSPQISESVFASGSQLPDTSGLPSQHAPQPSKAQLSAEPQTPTQALTDTISQIQRVSELSNISQQPTIRSPGTLPSGKELLSQNEEHSGTQVQRETELVAPSQSPVNRESSPAMVSDSDLPVQQETSASNELASIDASSPTPAALPVPTVQQSIQRSDQVENVTADTTSGLPDTSSFTPSETGTIEGAIADTSSIQRQHTSTNTNPPGPKAAETNLGITPPTQVSDSFQESTELAPEIIQKSPEAIKTNLEIAALIQVSNSLQENVELAPKNIQRSPKNNLGIIAPTQAQNLIQEEVKPALESIRKSPKATETKLRTVQKSPEATKTNLGTAAEIQVSNSPQETVGLSPEAIQRSPEATETNLEVATPIQMSTLPQENVEPAPEAIQRSPKTNLEITASTQASNVSKESVELATEAIQQSSAATKTNLEVATPIQMSTLPQENVEPAPEAIQRSPKTNLGITAPTQAPNFLQEGVELAPEAIQRTQESELDNNLEAGRPPIAAIDLPASQNTASESPQSFPEGQMQSYPITEPVIPSQSTSENSTKGDTLATAPAVQRMAQSGNELGSALTTLPSSQSTSFKQSEKPSPPTFTTSPPQTTSANQSEVDSTSTAPSVQLKQELDEPASYAALEASSSLQKKSEPSASTPEQSSSQPQIVNASANIEDSQTERSGERDSQTVEMSSTLHREVVNQPLTPNLASPETSTLVSTDVVGTVQRSPENPDTATPSGIPSTAQKAFRHQEHTSDTASVEGATTVNANAHEEASPSLQRTLESSKIFQPQGFAMEANVRTETVQRQIPSADSQDGVSNPEANSSPQPSIASIPEYVGSPPTSASSSSESHRISLSPEVTNEPSRLNPSQTSISEVESTTSSRADASTLSTELPQEEGGIQASLVAQPTVTTVNDVIADIKASDAEIEFSSESVVTPSLQTLPDEGMGVPSTTKTFPHLQRTSEASTQAESISTTPNTSSILQNIEPETARQPNIIPQLQRSHEAFLQVQSIDTASPDSPISQNIDSETVRQSNTIPQLQRNKEALTQAESIDTASPESFTPQDRESETVEQPNAHPQLQQKPEMPRQTNAINTIQPDISEIAQLTPNRAEESRIDSSASLPYSESQRSQHSPTESNIDLQAAKTRDRIAESSEPTVAQLLAQNTVPPHPQSVTSDMVVMQPMTAMRVIQPLIEEDESDAFSPMGAVPGTGAEQQARPYQVEQASESDRRQEQQHREESHAKQLDLRGAHYLPQGVTSGVHGPSSPGLMGDTTEAKTMMQETLHNKAKLKATFESRQGKPVSKMSPEEIGDFAPKVMPTVELKSQPEVTEDIEDDQEVDGHSVELLAREVYHLLQQRLTVERERYGGYYRDRAGF